MKKLIMLLPFIMLACTPSHPAVAASVYEVQVERCKDKPVGSERSQCLRDAKDYK
jgi:hypothetical protein